MSDLVGNPEERFSRVEAHIKVGYSKTMTKGITHSSTFIFSLICAIAFQYAKCLFYHYAAHLYFSRTSKRFG